LHQESGELVNEYLLFALTVEVVVGGPAILFLQTGEPPYL
jgi:hypothetical protein